MPLRLFRDLRPRSDRRQRAISEQAVPVALITPTRAETRHEEIPAFRLHANGDCVAVRTAISFRQQIKEEDRRENAAKDEKTTDDENAQNRVPHRATSPSLSLQPLLDFLPGFDVSDLIF